MVIGADFLLCRRKRLFVFQIYASSSEQKFKCRHSLRSAGEHTLHTVTLLPTPSTAFSALFSSEFETLLVEKRPLLLIDRSSP